MSFDFSTLITDRTQADVSRVKQIAEKIKNGTASESDLSEFNSAAMKGAYNYTDLNRVTEAMEALKAKLEGYGYAVPGYQRIKVPHVDPGATSRLPEGYLELSYIESTGTQYIDTGFTYGASNVGSRIVSDTIVGEAVTDTYALSGVGAKPCFYYGVRQYSATDRRLMYGKGNADGTTTIKYNNKRCVFDLDLMNKTYTVKDVESGSYLLNVSDIAVSTPTKTTPVTLFGRWRANSNDVGYIKERIYSCQIYNNGALVRNFVPCINPNGEVGLYDLVTAAFFGNSGTGSFVAGAVPRKLPEGYTQVEYIESSGTQYIDTGFKPNQDTKVVMDVKSQSGIDHVLFSARTSASSNVFEMIWSNSSNCYRFYYNNSNINMDGISVTPATRRTIEVDKNVATIDGYSVSRTYAAFQCECNMVLFARNTVGTIGAYTTGKLYSCQVFDNGTLIRDFVPCINPSGDVGLLDIVNGVFYQNAGSGAFAAGEEIVAPATASVMVTFGNADEYDPYTWYEFDWFTPETMTVYLLNVVALRSVFAVMKSTPSVSKDAVGLMVQEANNIEKILVDVNELLMKSTQVWFYSGELFAGEV